MSLLNPSRKISLMMETIGALVTPRDTLYFSLARAKPPVDVTMGEGLGLGVLPLFI